MKLILFIVKTFYYLYILIFMNNVRYSLIGINMFKFEKCKLQFYFVNINLSLKANNVAIVYNFVSMFYMV